MEMAASMVWTQMFRGYWGDLFSNISPTLYSAECKSKGLFDKMYSEMQKKTI